MLDGVKALTRQGSDAEAEEESKYPRNTPYRMHDSINSKKVSDADEDSEPDCVGDDNSSEEEAPEVSLARGWLHTALSLLSSFLAPKAEARTQ